jgi:hypothetical protein
MEIPPKINEPHPKVIEFEVVPPSAAPDNSDVANDPAPIHGLSALILVAVDSLWALFDLLPPTWVVAIPGCFLAVFVPTYLIQRNLKKDSPGRALTFAAILGVLAAIPTPITGTPVGLGLLAWTGLGRLLSKPAVKSR